MPDSAAVRANNEMVVKVDDAILCVCEVVRCENMESCVTQSYLDVCELPTSKTECSGTGKYLAKDKTLLEPRQSN